MTLKHAVERPAVEEFIQLSSNPLSPWGMADSDTLDLCNYILRLEAEIARLRTPPSPPLIHADEETEKAAASIAQMVDDWQNIGLSYEGKAQLARLIVRRLRRFFPISALTKEKGNDGSVEN